MTTSGTPSGTPHGSTSGSTTGTPHHSTGGATGGAAEGSTVGTRIRDLRVAKGLTQTALAGVGISAGYVSLIESGKRTPSTAMVAQIADRLGVPVDQILDGDRHPVSDEARIEVNFARLALSNGSPDEAIRTLRSLPLAELDARTACDATLVLAEALGQVGRIDEGVTALVALVERCRRDQSWIQLAQVATSLMVMHVEAGDLTTAVDVGRVAVKELESAGLEGTDEHIRLGAVYVWACYERGDLLSATRKVEELIKVADRVGSTRARGSIYWNAAIVAHGRGRIADALRLTDRAVALLGEQEEHRDLPRLRMHYAWLLLHQDAPQAKEALEQLDRAVDHPALAGSQMDLGLCATLRGQALLLLNEVDDAAEQAATALQLLGPSEHVDRVGALVLLGSVGVAQLNDDLAREAFGEARRVLAKMKESRATARMWRDLGDCLRDFGDLPGAVEAYDLSLRQVGLSKLALSNPVRVVSRMR